MSKLIQYHVSFTNNRGEYETISVMAYDGYDARRQIMNMTYGRARIIDISRG